MPVNAADRRSNQILNGQPFPSYTDLSSLSKIGTTSQSPTACIEQHVASTMREQFSKGIDCYKENLPKINNNKGLWQNFKGFDLISECHCAPQLRREKNVVNGRLLIENKIVDYAKQLQSAGKSPHLTSIGSGDLGQEIHILRGLTKEGIKNLRFDLIDLKYGNKKCKHHAPELNLFFVREVCAILKTGLALNITVGEKSDTDCGEFETMFKEELAQNQAPVSDDAPKVEIRFFETASEYKDNMPKAKSKEIVPRPNIIFDVDFIPARKDKNYEITDLLNVSDKNAQYLSLGKYGKTLETCVELETRTRTNGSWGKSSIQTL